MMSAKMLEALTVSKNEVSDVAPLGVLNLQHILDRAEHRPCLISMGRAEAVELITHARQYLKRDGKAVNEDKGYFAFYKSAILHFSPTAPDGLLRVFDAGGQRVLSAYAVKPRLGTMVFETYSLHGRHMQVYMTPTRSIAFEIGAKDQPLFEVDWATQEALRRHPEYSGTEWCNPQ